MKNKSIGRLISVIHRQGQIYQNYELKPYDLSSSDYIYLINLSENEGVNQKFLSDMLSIDDGFTTRAMKKLEEKGYIKREKNPGDKRGYHVKLTHKGQEIQPVILEKLKGWTDILSLGMTTDEKDQIIEKLEFMSANALAATSEIKKKS